MYVAYKLVVFLFVGCMSPWLVYMYSSLFYVCNLSAFLSLFV